MTAESTSLPVRRSPFGKRPRQPVEWLALFIEQSAASWLLAAFALALLVGAGIPAWRHLYPASAGAGWHYSLYLGALLPDGQGNLYISQEQPDGNGRLEVVLSHLRSPQTIVQTAAGRYLVAEQDRDRILELRRRPQ
ncbi:hypothetical protein D3C78_1286630 [compost metagenome]